MAVVTSTPVVAVFNNRSQAENAIDALREAGFTHQQIGVAVQDSQSGSVQGARNIDIDSDADEKAEDAGAGALAGAAAGAGVGGLIGLGVLSGVIPVIGPAIAAGTLGVILSNAAAGGAIAGLAGALIGWGVSDEDARYYESEFAAGRVILTINANGREAEARSILRQFGGTSRG